MDKITYNKIDKVDTALCNINTLQRLAERIAFDIYSGEELEEIAHAKVEELWTLLESINTQTKVIRRCLSDAMQEKQEATA